MSLVDSVANVCGDALQFSQAINVSVQALLFIPVDEGSGLAMVYGETLADGLFIVIGTAALLSAQDKAVHQFVFRNFEVVRAG